MDSVQRGEFKRRRRSAESEWVEEEKEERAEEVKKPKIEKTAPKAPARQKHTETPQDREKRQMARVEAEMRRYERIGLDRLSEKEKSAYDLDKQRLEVYRQKQELESGQPQGFHIQDEYVTAEGRIDTDRKFEALHGKNSVSFGEARLDVEKKGTTKFSHLKEEKAEKKYEYVFDHAQEVEFESEEEGEETPEQKRMAEEMARERKRVMDIKETRRSLPVFKYREPLLEAVKKYPVLIVVGETGSGKTTQLPQYLYEAGYSKGSKKIGCTQPRRVAATAVAARVAEEVGTRLGDIVGYSVRFDDKSGRKTAIKYMTDGMLLREFMSDSSLSSYSVMMVDEAHERTLHTDILLGLLKDISRQRPDFRLIISSATMDADKFSRYFDDAPIFNIPGRRFPVSVHYTKQPEANYLHAATTTVFQIHLSQEEGDILVFLTGQDEIETMAASLRATADKLEGMERRLMVCPIYANLPPEKQRLIFAPTPKKTRKVVLATNIAETSLTIDGIAYVIDSGFVKQDQFSPQTGIQSLSVVPCSRASADQRAGRAGRTGPGQCFRLYTKWAFGHEMPDSPTPEILRTNLAGVVLQMMSLGIADLIHFDFLDPPSPQALAKALEELYALGALNEKGEITRTGQQMAELPCDPMLAKCLISSGKTHCCAAVLSVVAMLEESGALFYGSKEKSEPTIEKFRANGSAQLGGDHLTLLEIWTQFEASGFSPQWCNDNSLQYRSLSRARNIRRQLERLCRKLGLLEEEEEMQSEEADRMRVRVMKAITSGFFANTAKLTRTGDGYKTLKKNQAVWIHPSSALFKMKPPPRLIVYSELVQTSREFMRNCMPISERWLREYAPHYYEKVGRSGGSEGSK